MRTCQHQNENDFLNLFLFKSCYTTPKCEIAVLSLIHLILIYWVVDKIGKHNINMNFLNRNQISIFENETAALNLGGVSLINVLRVL